MEWHKVQQAKSIRIPKTKAIQEMRQSKSSLNQWKPKLEELLTITKTLILLSLLVAQTKPQINHQHILRNQQII